MLVAQLKSFFMVARLGSITLAAKQLGLSQPTRPHHLRILAEAGLVTRSKRGVWAYYRLVPGALESLSGLLSTV